MAELILDVRLDGFEHPVGNLARDERGNLSFTYSDTHIKRDGTIPISLSLPLTDEPYGDILSRAFFGNLLQERDGDLQTVMAREGLERGDIAGLLYHLGRDCPGALSVLPRGSPPAKVPGNFATDYSAIDNNRLFEIVSALRARRPLPQGTQDPSPLAGVQSKIAVTILPDGRIAEPLPGSGAPTTHILKVPPIERNQDAQLELFTMVMAQAMTPPTSDVAISSIADAQVLIVTRFDRAVSADGKVTRIHQEDFAQALGLPSELKYERHGTCGRRFDAAAIGGLLRQTRTPAEARAVFIKNTIFDLMIGNADAHAKNHALLYDAGPRPVLAPRYDVVPTRLDPTLTDFLSYKIGRASRLSEVTLIDFYLFLNALGITNDAAKKRLLTQYAGTFLDAIAVAVATLDQRFGRRWGDLIASNCRHLADEFELAVPDTLRDRDAFVAQPMGWASS